MWFWWQLDGDVIARGDDAVAEHDGHNATDPHDVAVAVAVTQSRHEPVTTRPPRSKASGAEGRTVVMEFETTEQAQAWYDSDAYQEISEIRRAHRVTVPWQS